jgi:hypothetical protein
MASEAPAARETGTGADDPAPRLQRYVVHAVEAILRGSEWEGDLGTFFKTNCPRFQDFSANYGDAGKYVDLDLQMTVVHLEFVALVEDKIKGVLREMGVTAQVFLDSAQLNLALKDEAVARLFAATEYHDFHEFARMMERKCQQVTY